MLKSNYITTAIITAVITLLIRIGLCGGFHLNFHIDIVGFISHMDWMDLFYIVVALIHFSVLIAVLLAFKKNK